MAGSMSILREGKSIGDLHFLPQRGRSIAHCASTVHELLASRSVSQNRNIATIVCMHIIGTKNVSVWFTDLPVSTSILHQFKYHNQRRYGALLAKEMVSVYEQTIRKCDARIDHANSST